MRRNIFAVGILLCFFPVVARAQQPQPHSPIHEDIYCSGMVTTRAIPRDIALISGEQSLSKLTFSQGDYVYINKGSSQGVKVGDQFLVMRPVGDIVEYPWFTTQPKLLHSMGQPWADEGQLKVVVAQPNVSIAQIVDSCNYMQRGDVVLPFAQRPVPTLKPESNFDRFAPPSGKAQGVVVAGKSFQIQSSASEIVYVNLGSSQGVKVGDYVRVFRYQGNNHETLYQTPDMATDVYGYGKATGHYSWKDLPREVVGEGIVLRATPHSSTVLITFSLREVLEGDYCELE